MAVPSAFRSLCALLVSQFPVKLQVSHNTSCAAPPAGQMALHPHLGSSITLFVSVLSVHCFSSYFRGFARAAHLFDSSLAPLRHPFRKEVIQPHLPVRLPCYDFVPVIRPTLGSSSLAVKSPTSGVPNSHDVTGGVYKARERIHGVVADTPLLAIPTSCSRVADYNLNWGRLFRISSASRFRCLLYRPL